MTATRPLPSVEYQHRGEPALRAARCEACGSPLAAEQEWCLECGAARTVIRRPPDWRIGAGIVAIVVLLVAAAFAIALINLSNHASRSAATASASLTSTTSAAGSGATRSTTTATSTHSAPAAGPPLPGWSSGLPGYTVVLSTARSQAAADTVARRLSAAGIASVGVLDSSQHAALAPGQWLVFSGRYPSMIEAQAAATALLAKGYSARAQLIGRPGG